MGHSAKTAVSLAFLTTLMTVPALAGGDSALPQTAAGHEPLAFHALRDIAPTADLLTMSDTALAEVEGSYVAPMPTVPALVPSSPQLVTDTKALPTMTSTRFTTISNTMKTRSDSQLSTVSNVR